MTPADSPLTFQGIPVVFDKAMDDFSAKLYVFSVEGAEKFARHLQLETRHALDSFPNS